MRNLPLIFVIILGFCLGLSIMYKTKNQFLDPYQEPAYSSRDPAAIKKVYDFSGLDGPALNSAAKQRLLSGAEIINQKSEVGIKLGHFVLRNQTGQKQFACQKYSKIILEFEGDGMISGNQKPKMEVEGACEFSGDINNISPLYIPIAKILGEPVGDGEFDFRDGNQIKVRFANVNSEWPRLWKLSGIKLFDKENSNQDVIINDKELNQYVDKPLIIQFNQ